LREQLPKMKLRASVLREQLPKMKLRVSYRASSFRKTLKV
jgi:hypothetical protein